MPRILIVMTLALALAACAAPPNASQTASAATQGAQVAAVALAQTQTAGAPSATARPTDTPTATDTTAPTATPTATASATDTATPEPSATPTPTATATATRTPAPPVATPLPPSATPQPAPDFVTTVKAVRAQVDNIGWQADQGMRYYYNFGFVDCQQIISSFEYVVARRDFAVAPELAGPYALYQSAVDTFTDTSRDLYLNCLNTPTETRLILKPVVPMHQLTTARQGVYDADALFAQAIVAAGGEP